MSIEGIKLARIKEDVVPLIRIFSVSTEDTCTTEPVHIQYIDIQKHCGVSRNRMYCVVEAGDCCLGQTGSGNCHSIHTFDTQHTYGHPPKFESVDCWGQEPDYSILKYHQFSNPFWLRKNTPQNRWNSCNHNHAWAYGETGVGQAGTGVGWWGVCNWTTLSQLCRYTYNL